MSLTGAQLLTGLSTFIDDAFSSTTTSTGASDGSTIVDTALEIFGDNRLVGWFVRITDAGTASNTFKVSRVTSNAQATGTVQVSPPFPAQVLVSRTYELHQYEPKKKFAALDSARIPVANDVFKLIVDETITTDGLSSEYEIPSTIHRGPAICYIEQVPWSPQVTWNFIPTPMANDGMSVWTTSNATLSTYTRVPQDAVVPKYGPACTKVSVAASVTGTVTLTVANMTNNVTAALAAGRQMTAAIWVYSKLAGSLTITILDDSGVIGTSNIHQGKGWEVLYVTASVSATNATTLSVRINETSASAATFFVNNMWFYYGYYTKVNSQFFNSRPIRIRRDDTTKRFIIAEPFMERRQLRLIGKDTLTALGTSVATQVTNSMEVDETTAEILYAQAATILFEQERLSTQNMAQVLQRIQSVQARLPEIRMNWDFGMETQRITSPYAR